MHMRRNMVADRIIWLLGGLLASVGLTAHAETPAGDQASVDKSAYHLFNPTPSQYLRAMDTDGPGTTESPYTVDAGHVQIEMTFLASISDRDRFEGETYELDVWALAPMILRLGVLNRLDAQVVLEPYLVVRERVGTNLVTLRGFGDTTLRLKYNFWGNDSGRTAF